MNEPHPSGSVERKSTDWADSLSRVRKNSPAFIDSPY